MDGSDQWPLSSVALSKVWLVSEFTTFTTAPGTAAPCESVTFPSSRPVVTCAINTPTNTLRIRDVTVSFCIWALLYTRPLFAYKPQQLVHLRPDRAAGQ